MYKALIVILLAAAAVAAQSDVQKLVDAEHAFAQTAAEKGTKAAFLANMTDDAVVFNPEKVNARANWMSKGESKGLLAWAPNYADISSDGALGYTTGNWEFRPKGQADAPVAFGDFVTIWRRQADGNYKWIIDIGISHDKPAAYSTEWKTTTIARDKVANRGTISAAFDEFAVASAKTGLGKAYEQSAGENIRVYRPDKMPILGKKASIANAVTEPAKMSIEPSPAVSSGDLAYVLTEYRRTLADGKTEKGYILQIWKLYVGKWHLELDILDPVPTK